MKFKDKLPISAIEEIVSNTKDKILYALMMEFIGKNYLSSTYVITKEDMISSYEKFKNVCKTTNVNLIKFE